MIFILCTRKYDQVPRQIGFVTGSSLEQAVSTLGVTITSRSSQPYCGEAQVNGEHVYFQEILELNTRPALIKAVEEGCREQDSQDLLSIPGCGHV